MHTQPVMLMVHTPVLLIFTGQFVTHYSHGEQGDELWWRGSWEHAVHVCHSSVPSWVGNLAA